MLVIFGPKKLPKIAKELGKAVQEFRKASTDLSNTTLSALKEDNVEKTLFEIAKYLEINTQDKSKDQIIEEVKEKIKNKKN